MRYVIKFTSKTQVVILMGKYSLPLSINKATC